MSIVAKVKKGLYGGDGGPLSDLAVLVTHAEKLEARVKELEAAILAIDDESWIRAGQRIQALRATIKVTDSVSETCGDSITDRNDEHRTYECNLPKGHGGYEHEERLDGVTVAAWTSPRPSEAPLACVVCKRHPAEHTNEELRACLAQICADNEARQRSNEATLSSGSAHRAVDEMRREALEADAARTERRLTGVGPYRAPEPRTDNAQVRVPTDAAVVMREDYKPVPETVERVKALLAEKQERKTHTWLRSWATKIVDEVAPWSGEMAEEYDYNFRIDTVVGFLESFVDTVPCSETAVLEAARACIEAWNVYGLFSDKHPELAPDPNTNLGKAEAATRHLRRVLTGSEDSR